MDDDLSLPGVVRYFSDFDSCQQLVVKLRWGDGKVRCPQCGSEKVTYLERTRVWKCYRKHTRAKFSLKTGTIFEDSPISLVKWIPTAWLVINCGHRVSSSEVHRALGVTQKTAWFMMHRIRLAMLGRSRDDLGGDAVVNASPLRSPDPSARGADLHGGKRWSKREASVAGALERAEKAPDPMPTMKFAPISFETTPEFEHFIETMSDVLAVSKAELDRRVQEASGDSDRNRKRAKRVP
jgi:transposase-like protein